MSLDRPLKVIQVFQEYPVFYQPYIPPVVDALINKADLDLKINVYKGHSKGPVFKLPSYHFRRIYEAIYQIFKNSPSKLNYLEIQSLKQKVDVLHIQDSFLHPKIVGLLEMEVPKRPKIVITLRGGDTYVKPWISKIWADFYKTYGTKVDAFITMSEHQKTYLQQWGVPKHHIHVIPISFGERFFIKPKTPNTDKMKIISAFRLCWEKNIEGNLRVISYLKDQGVPVHYDLYGDGPDVGQVFYLIDKYQLTDCVIFHGRLHNTVLKEQLKQSDFFLQLSHSESLGMSVIEAQSMGLPAIISNSDGLPETILPFESGFSVDPWDIQKAAHHIIDLWNDTAKYQLFSEKAITFSHANFSVENEVERLMDLYQKLSSSCVDF